MGVHKLWSVLEPSSKPVKLDSLDDQVLAVDASIWLYQFITALKHQKSKQSGEFTLEENNTFINAHLLGFFRRICKLIHYGIKPIFVFDGEVCDLKKQTIRERQQKKEGNRESSKAVARRLLAIELLNKNLKNTDKKKSSKNIDKPDKDILSKKQNKLVSPQHKTSEWELPEQAELHYHKDDGRMATINEYEDTMNHVEDELQGIDLESVNPVSEEFNNLPKSTQYMILYALRSKSRLRMGYSIEQLRAMFPNPNEFSRFQIEMVKRRNFFSQKLLDSTGMHGDSQVTKGKISGTKKMYMLIKTENGWAMSLDNKDGSSKENAINITNEEIDSFSQIKHQTSKDNDEDWEDVDLDMSPEKKVEVEDYSIKALIDATRQRLIEKSPYQKFDVDTSKSNDSLENDVIVLSSCDEDDDGPSLEAKNIKEQAKIDLTLQIQQLDNHDEKTVEEKTRPSFAKLKEKINKTSIAENEMSMDLTNKQTIANNKRVHDSDFNDEAEILQKKSKRNKIVTIDLFGSGHNGEVLELSEDDDDFEDVSVSPDKNDLQKANSLTPTESAIITNTSKPESIFTIASSDAVENFNTEKTNFKLLPSHVEEKLSTDNSTDKKKHEDSTTFSKPGNFSVEEKEHLENEAMFEIPNEEFENDSKDPILDEVSSKEMLPNVIQLNSPNSKANDITVLKQEFNLNDSSDRKEVETKVSKEKEEKSDETNDESNMKGLFDDLDEQPPLEIKPIDLLEKKSTNDTVNKNAINSNISDGDDDFFQLDNEPIISKPISDNFKKYAFFEDEEMELVDQMDKEEKDYTEFIQPLKSNNVSENQINQVFVDDGNTEVSEDAPHNDILGYNQLISRYKKLQRDAEEVTPQMTAEVQELLQCFGVPYITAPMEAEAQCAELMKLKLADGIITDDSDVFLFGGSKIYRKMFQEKQFVEFYDLQSIDGTLGLSKQQLIEMAFLLGSDYTNGIKGIGPVAAIEILAHFGNLESFNKWYNNGMHDQNIINSEGDFEKKLRKRLLANDVILPENWPYSAVKKEYNNPTVDSDKTPFKWGNPDLDQLRALLRNYLGWHPDRSDEVLIPLIKKMNQKAKQPKQRKVTDFFLVDHSQNQLFGTSKRMAKAIQSLKDSKKSSI